MASLKQQKRLAASVRAHEISMANSSCNTEFANENEQKNDRYEYERYRYYLKCKIAEARTKEKNKLNELSKLYTCGLCGKGFGSYEARAQHLNSQSHIKRDIRDGHLNSQSHITRHTTLAKENNKLNAPSKDGHLNESTPIVKALSPHMVNKLSQNEDEFDDVSDGSDEWEEVDGSDEWEVVDGSDEWEEVDVSAMNARKMTNK